MWPWKRQATASERPWPLEDRLMRVEKTLEDLATSVRKVKLEWEDVYDRLERMVGRINARARSDRTKAEEPPPGAPEVDVAAINDAIRRGVYPASQVRRT